MKTKYFLMVLMLVCINYDCIRAQGNGFVTLDGRQFKDGIGAPIYPVMVCYSVELTFNPSNFPPQSPSDWFICASSNYGAGVSGLSNPNWFPNSEHENTSQAACLAQIHADFVKIKSMGFNTVRLCGVCAFKPKLLFDYSGFYCVNDVLNGTNHPVGSQKASYFLSPNYFTDAYTQHMFYLLDLVIQEAQSVGGIFIQLDETRNGIIYESHDIADDYANYLAAKADYFKNNTTIMAHIMVEEPWQSNLTKQQVCAYTAQWYDAIKANDENHLITIGGFGQIGIFQWEPNVMKMDFFSLHFYPDHREVFEVPFTQQFVNDRIQGQLYWMSNVLQMPWMIGETGFAAIDDWWFGTNVYPNTDGTIAEQKLYAEQTLDWVRQSQASGYSWWNYQENWWGSYKEDGYGLLRHDDITNPNFFGGRPVEKDVVAAFTNYTATNGNLVAPKTIAKPANYYDPYNHATFSPNTNIIHGTVLDENNNPIENAVVFGYNELGTDLNGDITFNYHYTFTKDGTNGTLGEFDLIPFDFDIQAPNNNQIIDLQISASGCERAARGWNDFGANPLLWPVDNSPAGETFVLKSTNFKYDGLVQNKNIINGQTENYQGWNSLTAQNIDVDNGGNSEIKARQTVNIKTEFYAKSASEVHIYCDNTFPVCDDLSNFLRQSNIIENNIMKDDPKNIEISFQPKQQALSFTIFPNPSDGIFTLKIIDETNSETPYHLTILNVLGKKILETEILNLNTQLELVKYTNGIYFLQLNNQTQKLIIQ